ncbi:MAG: hypothetical protein V4662_25100 [Verrucomicrobiota bacterium]
MAEKLLTCPDCGQKNFTASGLKTHRGGKTCQRRMQALEVGQPAAPATSLAVTALPDISVMGMDEATMAAAIKDDIQRYERTSKEAAYVALRIGLRLIWIRDNEAYGSLTSFIKQNFGGAKSSATLYNYISTAGQFLKDAGMLDKTTHKLTGKALTAAAPIVTEQLELFTDPKAKLEGTMKKLVKWVGTRGLSEIYKDLAAKKKAASAPPPGGKSAKNNFAGGAVNKTKKGLHSSGVALELVIAHAEQELDTIGKAREAKAWESLDDAKLGEYSNLLLGWAEDIKTLLKERQSAALRAKGKGAKS